MISRELDPFFQKLFPDFFRDDSEGVPLTSGGVGFREVNRFNIIDIQGTSMVEVWILARLFFEIVSNN
jgi:hypothetical protein